jgi:hypothetical protein
MTRRQRKYMLDMIAFSYRVHGYGSSLWQTTMREWEFLGWVKRWGTTRNATPCFILTRAGQRQRQVLA